MFFRDLPDNLNPGRISLSPVGGVDGIITTCDACGEFSLRRVLGSCGHVFCWSCCIVRNSPAGLELRCSECKKNSACERVELTESFLRDMAFICGCGHEGNLAQIREHLWTCETDHFIKDPSSAPSSSTPNLAVTTNPTFQDHSSQMALIPAKSVVPDSTLAAARKENLIKVIQAELKPLWMMSARIGLAKTKAYFCFELHKLMDDFVYKRFTQEHSTLTWATGEYPAQVYCKITVVADKRYLSVFFKPINDPPSFSGWPMKKKITIELYNIKGEPVHKKMAVTFANNEPTWDGFIRPYHPHELGGHGFEKFYAIDDLLTYDPRIVVNGKVCLSVKLEDL